MDKKEIIEYLTGKLKEATKKHYDNEVNYRVLTSMVMQNPSDKNLLGGQTQSIKLKTVYKTEISQLRGVISELEKGTLEVV